MATSEVQITIRGAGEWIKIERERKRLSAKRLAELADLDPSVLSRIENNLLGMSTEILYRIATALDISPLQFAQGILNHVHFGMGTNPSDGKT